MVAGHHPQTGLRPASSPPGPARRQMRCEEFGVAGIGKARAIDQGFFVDGGGAQSRGRLTGAGPDPQRSSMAWMTPPALRGSACAGGHLACKRQFGRTGKARCGAYVAKLRRGDCHCFATAVPLQAAHGGRQARQRGRLSAQDIPGFDGDFGANACRLAARQRDHRLCIGCALLRAHFTINPRIRLSAVQGSCWQSSVQAALGQGIRNRGAYVLFVRRQVLQCARTASEPSGSAHCCGSALWSSRSLSSLASSRAMSRGISFGGRLMRSRTSSGVLILGDTVEVITGVGTAPAPRGLRFGLCFGAAPAGQIK